MFNKEFLQVFGSEPLDWERLSDLVSEVKEFALEIDRETLAFVVTQQVNGRMSEFFKLPQVTKFMEEVEAMLRILQPLSLNLEVGKAQNIYFAVGEKFYPQIRTRADQGDEASQRWVDYFHQLGEYLKVKITFPEHSIKAFF
jgi:hypothetical protein